ncbi:hypothetical protein KI387_014368 [Taxus chinensis]|uniref:Fe2OG dioxygenase domain-containing protein n=1 Tax=Taxus chinensis TaxID=29808 RepID=A0AA38FHV3_TAXCH|nr:hypothetical protein KI387_014368 [Taxus chinensis]
MEKSCPADDVNFGNESSRPLRCGATMTSDRSHCNQIPKAYIRPLSERPRLDEVALSDDISLIDLTDLNGPNRQLAIHQIQRACQEDGFFHVINHGVPDTDVNTMLAVATEFFTMPTEFREQFYSEDPSSVVRLSTSFNVHKENVCNWRYYLRHHCYPLEKYIDAWPSRPHAYREVVGKYCREVRALVIQLLAAISESLGLEPHFLDKALGNHAQHMAINYYPRCPNPELTFGLPAHSDPNALTVLLQGHVSGLQVLRNGRWCAVQPIPNAFVVNLGDQLEVLSNGIYKSAIHRAVVNCSEARISVPTFYCPSPDAVIQPAPGLITCDNPARYRKFTYEEYYEKFWSKDLVEKTCLNSFTTDGLDANTTAPDDK